MKRVIASFALGVAVLPSAASAQLEAKPRGTIQWVEPEASPGPRPAGISSDIIYLNRCAGGCTLTPGANNSITNKSNIIPGAVTVSEFAHGDADWDYVVQCVKDIYEPYAVEITDVDPGNTPHFEAIVAGIPSDIGQDNGVGGVSPFTCGIIDNAITFSFANVYRDPQDICVTVAQESAHAFGLEHEFLCADPMTYLSGCSNKKFFQDADAQCGEFEARPCDCRVGTQNSHQELAAMFGTGAPTPPTVTFVRPLDGANVNPAFPIEVDAKDNVGVTRVEVFINGAKVTESSLRPFIFNAPADTPGGPVAVEVRAYDNRENMTSSTITVNQGDPCTQDSCPDSMVCLSGNCIDGPSTPGGLGSVCGGNEDCNSALCGDNGTEKLCTAPCGTGCPEGFDCVGEDGPMPVCWPAPESGACAATPSSQVPWQFGLIGLLGLAFTVRRRRR
jgi:hypothetical protein